MTREQVVGRSTLAAGQPWVRWVGIGGAVALAGAVAFGVATSGRPTNEADGAAAEDAAAEDDVAEDAAAEDDVAGDAGELGASADPGAASSDAAAPGDDASGAAVADPADPGPAPDRTTAASATRAPAVVQQVASSARRGPSPVAPSKPPVAPSPPPGSEGPTPPPGGGGTIIIPVFPTAFSASSEVSFQVGAPQTTTVELAGRPVIAGRTLTFHVDPPSSGTVGPVSEPVCDDRVPTTCTATIEYTPCSDLGCEGEVTFHYRVRDEFGRSGGATVRVAVTRENTPPVVGEPEGGLLHVRSGDPADPAEFVLRAFDADHDPLTFSFPGELLQFGTVLSPLDDVSCDAGWCSQRWSYAPPPELAGDFQRPLRFEARDGSEVFDPLGSPLGDRLPDSSTQVGWVQAGHVCQPWATTSWFDARIAPLSVTNPSETLQGHDVWGSCSEGWVPGHEPLAIVGGCAHYATELDLDTMRFHVAYPPNAPLPVETCTARAYEIVDGERTDRYVSLVAQPQDFLSLLVVTSPLLVGGEVPELGSPSCTIPLSSIDDDTRERLESDAGYRNFVCSYWTLDEPLVLSGIIDLTTAQQIEAWEGSVTVFDATTFLQFTTVNSVYRLNILSLVYNVRG
jgi:hypothetical protein